MKPIIGFAGDGHLASYSAKAATMKGFTVSKKIRECDIVFIAPDRPGDMSPQEAVDLVMPHLRKDALLVVLCQVEPGFTGKIKWPNEQLYYLVETLKVNDEALERAVNPERLIVGSFNSSIGGVFLSFLESFACPILVMSPESAEFTKIAINIYLASQVCTTNTLAETAMRVGAAWGDIIPALQLDKRIGMDAYLKPGHGLSKHLLRDLEAVHKIGGNTKVTDAFLEHSEYRRKQVE